MVDFSFSMAIDCWMCQSSSKVCIILYYIYCLCLSTSWSIVRCGPLENSSPTMSDLYNWLHPLKEVASNDSSKSISALVGVVKELTPLLSVHRPGKANSPIITSLRLLLTYVRPPGYSTNKGMTITEGGVIYICGELILQIKPALRSLANLSRPPQIFQIIITQERMRRPWSFIDNTMTYLTLVHMVPYCNNYVYSNITLVYLSKPFF